MRISKLSIISIFYALFVLASPFATGQTKHKYKVDVNFNGAILQRPLGIDLGKVKEPGTVIVNLKLAKDGTVIDSTIISGNESLRSIVLQAVSSWKFVQDTKSGSWVQAWIYFMEDRGVPASQQQPVAPPPIGAPLGSIEIQGVGKEQEAEIRKRIAAKPGDPLTQELWDRAKRVAREQSPTLNFQVRLGPNSFPYIRIWR